MWNRVKSFTFPYTNLVLILSALILFLSFFGVGLISSPESANTESINLWAKQLRLWFFITKILTAISVAGFIYSTLGFHFKTVRGDELKLKIHLDSLNIAFTTTLISFFILIFIFLNFAPSWLNYILLFLSIIGIITYLIASLLIKDKYS